MKPVEIYLDKKAIFKSSSSNDVSTLIKDTQKYLDCFVGLEIEGEIYIKFLEMQMYKQGIKECTCNKSNPVEWLKVWKEINFDLNKLVGNKRTTRYLPFKHCHYIGNNTVIMNRLRNKSLMAFEQKDDYIKETYAFKLEPRKKYKIRLDNVVLSFRLRQNKLYLVEVLT